MPSLWSVNVANGDAMAQLLELYWKALTGQPGMN
jgi:hypothetical protein